MPNQPNKFLDLVYKNFKPQSHFLDLGCGQGQDALFMTKNNFNVTAIEKSEVAVKQIQKIIKENNLKNIEVINSNVLDFEIEKDKYDIINCRNILQFLPKDKALNLIKDIQDKIKANGYILLAAFTTDDPSFNNPKNKNIKSYFEPQEVLKLFSNFRIIYYLENIILDKGHVGSLEPHRHGIVKIIVQKI